MIAPPQSDDEKATAMVVFHLIPLAIAFLVGLFAIYTLVDSFVMPFGAKQYQTNFSVLSQVSSPPLNSPPLSTLFTKEILYWRSAIERWATEYELDPNLVAVVMQVESCGYPNVISPAGALGLFQVMPYHFADGENPLDPSVNARRGLDYLARALQLANGDISQAMAGYNGGHALIQWNPMHWSEETIRYVYWTSGIYADITKGTDESPRLAEWLAAGGRSLCSRAALALNS